MDDTASTPTGSLMGRIPPELLGTIFTLCLPAVDVTQPSITRIAKEAAREYQLQPFQLAAVSRQWRSASLHWPRAWSHIEICSDRNVETTKSMATMLDVILSRSASTWLVVRVSRAILAFPHHHEHTIAQLLSKHMGRCRTVYFDFERVWKSDSLLSILQVPTPQLRDAYLWSDETAGQRHLDFNTLFLQDAPLLKNLKWSTPFICRVSSLKSLQYTELIAVTITSEQNQLTPILQACPNLVLLEISFAPTRNTVDHPGQEARVRCPALQHIIIRNATRMCDMINILSHINAPELQKVTTDGTFEHCSERLAFTRHVLTVERPAKLTRIAIGELAMMPCLEKIKSLFQDMPQVESLSIFGTKFDGEGLAAFCTALLPSAIVSEQGPAVADTTMWPLPMLKRLYLRNCSFPDDCNLSELVACIRARVEAASQKSDQAPTLLHYFKFIGPDLPLQAEVGAEIEYIIASKWGADEELLAGIN